MNRGVEKVAWVSFVFHFEGQVSFLEGLIQLQSCRTQDVESSIKFSRTLPDCCKRSTPSSLFGT